MSSSTSTSRSSGESSGRAIVTGNRRDRFTDARGYGVTGWEYVHVCVDDATRLAYVEVLADERGKTADKLLRRAAQWFSSLGITLERVMSDGCCSYVKNNPRPAAIWELDQLGRGS